MTVDEKLDALRAAVKALQAESAGLTRSEREDRLIDVGCCASIVDGAALDLPAAGADLIREETDSLVSIAEGVIEAHDSRDVLANTLANRVRASANRRKI